MSFDDAFVTNNTKLRTLTLGERTTLETISSRISQLEMCPQDPVIVRLIVDIKTLFEIIGWQDKQP